jgi:hypothetical protein
LGASKASKSLIKIYTLALKSGDTLRAYESEIKSRA